MAVLGTVYGAVNGMRRSIHPTPKAASPALKAPHTPAQRALPVRARTR